MSEGFTNKYGLPNVVMQSIASDHWYDKGDCDLSVTELIGPPQVSILKKLPHTVDASSHLYMLQGSAVHKVLESVEEHDCIMERRFSMEVAGMKIGGQVDHFCTETNTVSDYKNTSINTLLYNVRGYRDDWEKQLNVYALLVSEELGVEVSGVQTHCFYRDWSESQAKRNPELPLVPFKTVRIPLWDKEDALTYLQNRVTVHVLAKQQYKETGECPPCTEEERWYRRGKLAVMMPSRKKALRLFDSKDIGFAESMARNKPGSYIEERPGKSMRCANSISGSSYCPVASICPQAKRGTR